MFNKLDKETCSEFGEFISFMRQSIGMSQAELGERLGVDRKVVSRWEKGVSLMRYDI